MSAKPSRKRHPREYVPLLEAFLVAPVLALLLLGALEVRHALNVEDRLTNAAKVAAVEAGRPITISVAYSATDSLLGFLWPSAEVTASSNLAR